MVNTFCGEHKKHHHGQCTDILANRLSEAELKWTKEGWTYGRILVHEVGSMASLYSLLVFLASLRFLFHLRSKHQLENVEETKKIKKW